MFLMFVISIIIYIVAVMVLYHNLYNYDKASKIKLILVGLIIILIITSVICLISSNGTSANKDLIKITRNISILLFAPINSIISLTYIANVINKYKGEKINEKQMKKRIFIYLVILVFIYVFEVAYITDFQNGLLKGVNN